MTISFFNFYFPMVKIKNLNLFGEEFFFHLNKNIDIGSMGLGTRKLKKNAICIKNNFEFQVSSAIIIIH